MRTKRLILNLCIVCMSLIQCEKKETQQQRQLNDLKELLQTINKRGYSPKSIIPDTTAIRYIEKYRAEFINNPQYDLKSPGVFIISQPMYRQILNITRKDSIHLVLVEDQESLELILDAGNGKGKYFITNRINMRDAKAKFNTLQADYERNSYVIMNNNMRRLQGRNDNSSILNTKSIKIPFSDFSQFKGKNYNDYIMLHLAITDEPRFRNQITLVMNFIEYNSSKKMIKLLTNSSYYDNFCLVPPGGC